MKILSTLMIIGFMIATAGCMYQPEVSKTVNWDYNVNYDFTKLETYDWTPISMAEGVDNFTANRIRKAVDAQMQSRGINQSSNKPDVLIIIYGGANKMPTTIWRGVDAPLYYEKGRLHFTLLDPQTDSVVWWAKADAKLNPESTPEEEDKMINEVVTRIFEKFPPKPAS